MVNRYRREDPREHEKAAGKAVESDYEVVREDLEDYLDFLDWIREFMNKH